MIFAVKFRENVKLIATPALACLLASLKHAVDTLKHDVTVTCAAEPQKSHGPTNPHTLGEALDVSVFGLNELQIAQLFSTVVAFLGPLFYVQVEVPILHAFDAKVFRDFGVTFVVSADATAPHMHMQRAKNTIYPPQVNS